MNKSASPRRIINTCLPAHRYNCMLMPCTSATCCRLLNAEYNTIQVHCEGVPTRSKVCWKEWWLPSVTFTWNIDEVNLWINISAFSPSPKEMMLTLSLCSLQVGKDTAHPVELCFRINSETWPVLWLWCGWFTEGTTFFSFWPVDSVWQSVKVEVHSVKTETPTVSYLISLSSPTEDRELWLCKSKRCFSLLSGTIICASHTAKNKNTPTNQSENMKAV